MFIAVISQCPMRFSGAWLSRSLLWLPKVPSMVCQMAGVDWIRLGSGERTSEGLDTTSFVDPDGSAVEEHVVIDTHTELGVGVAGCCSEANHDSQLQRGASKERAGC